MFASLSPRQKDFLLLIACLIVAWAIGMFVFDLNSLWWLVVPFVMVVGAIGLFILPAAREAVQTMPQDLQQIRQSWPTLPLWRKLMVPVIIMVALGFLYVFWVVDPLGLRPLELFGIT